jgi:hypothetical protein
MGLRVFFSVLVLVIRVTVVLVFTFILGLVFKGGIPMLLMFIGVRYKLIKFHFMDGGALFKFRGMILFRFKKGEILFRFETRSKKIRFCDFYFVFCHFIFGLVVDKH